MAKHALIFLLLLCLAPASQAAIEVYDFSSDENRVRFHSLGHILRCPMCENQSIIDSDSPSAFDMRQELFRLLEEEGMTDRQIKDHLVARFGDYVLYRPPLRSETWMLWFLPPILVVGGLLLVFLLARARSGQTERKSSASEETQAERQARLKKLLEMEASESSQSDTKG